MFRFRTPLMVGASVVLLAVTALAVVTFTTPAGSAPAASAMERCGPGSALNFVPSDFQDSPRIDNEWIPLEPGMEYTLEGTVTSADGVLNRVVVHTVTGLSKIVNGIVTRVLWDRDYADTQLAESELAFFAQTGEGAVWLLGEYPEEYENGEFVGAPSTFISGVDGAVAGIVMPAAPQTDTPAHVQAHAPSVGFLDCGTVLRQGDQACTPVDCYENVLVIEETNPLDPDDGHQHKFYSVGLGNIQVTAVGGANQEELRLVKIRRLDAPQLDAVNVEAVTLDRRAFEVSPDVYGTTPRAVIDTPAPRN